MQHAVVERRAMSNPRTAGFALRVNRVGVAVFLYGTLCAIMAAFVVYHKQSLIASTIDVNGFGLLSRNVALGDGFSLGYGPTIRRAPLYPLFGAAVLKITGQALPGIPDEVAYQPIIFVQCLLFGLTVLFTWLTARKLFGSRVALIAAILCPLVPQSLRYVGQTEVETLTELFIAILAYTGVRLWERPSWVNGAAFGLTAAAATLTKPVTQFFPFLFLAIAWILWSRRATVARAISVPVRTRVHVSVAVLAFFVLPLLPWMARNWVVTAGQFVGISSNAPGESLRGYVAVQPKYYLLGSDFGDWDPEANTYEEDVLAQFGVPFYRWNSPSAGSMEVTPPIPAGLDSATLDAQKDHLESSVLVNRILHQPQELIGKIAVQTVTYWYLVVDRRQSLLVGLVALGVLVLAVLGIARAGRERLNLWPIVALVVYSNLVYAGTLAMARYSMPLFPTLMILAAAGLMSLVPSGLAHRATRQTSAPARGVA